jgi:cobalt/nickel transport protein
MGRKEILFGLLIALILAGIFSLFACPWPDGLEKVAGDKGFFKKGNIEPVFASPIPDYSWPGVKNEKLATSLAGTLGTLVVFGITWALAVLIKRHDI